MYRISQFSKISGVTVKALRYYDEEGILKPSFRNGENQYRYYSDEDLKKARLISFLRSLDFSIMEIREIADTVENEAELAFILQEKAEFIKNNIAREKELLQKIGRNVFPPGTGHPVNAYQIGTVDIGGVFAASIRFTGWYSDMDKYVPLLYKAVGGNRSGRLFNCYYDTACVENADIEICLPVKNRIAGAHVSCRKLPGLRGLRTVHYGGYDTLYLAYKAMFEFANKHSLKTLTPSREIYVKGPGMIFKGNPANYITEIILPIKFY